MRIVSSKDPSSILAVHQEFFACGKINLNNDHSSKKWHWNGHAIFWKTNSSYLSLSKKVQQKWVLQAMMSRIMSPAIQERKTNIVAISPKKRVKEEIKGGIRMERKKKQEENEKTERKDREKVRGGRTDRNKP